MKQLGEICGQPRQNNLCVLRANGSSTHGLGRDVRKKTQATFPTHRMKNIIKHLAIIAAVVALTSSAFAGECCVKAAADAKNGKVCEKCATKACCKETVKKLGEEAKPCEKCAKVK